MTRCERMILANVIAHIKNREARFRNHQFTDVTPEASVAVADELVQVAEYIEALKLDLE